MLCLLGRYSLYSPANLTQKKSMKGFIPFIVSVRGIFQIRIIRVKK